MKQVSDFFLKSYNEGTLDKYYISELYIYPAGGDVIHVPEEHISLTNNIFSSGGDENGFLIGKVVIDTLQLEIINNNYIYDGVNFINAGVSCKVSCDVENNGEIVTETFDLGNWTILTTEVTGNYITLNLARMYAGYIRPAWSKFTTTHNILTARQVVEIVSNALDLELISYEAINDSAKFLFSSDGLYKMNENVTTCVQILEVMAYFAGGYIYIDINGNLNTTTYSMDTLTNEISAGYWGGVFDDNDNVYISSDKLDGGYFTDEENPEVSVPSFDNLKKIIHVPGATIFNFTHNTDYTKPTGIKYGYSGTSVNQNESVTGDLTVIAPNKSSLVELGEFYKYLTFTGIDNKGANNIYVTLYDENGNVVKAEFLVNKNVAVDMYNNNFHAKKFSIRSAAAQSNGSVRLSTPNMSNVVTNRNYNRLTVTGITDRLGRSYSSITAHLYPYAGNTQLYEKVSANVNSEIVIKDRKEIAFTKGNNDKKSISYSGTNNGSIIAVGKWTELTINSFTNSSYVNVALLKSNNASDIISTHRVTKATHIPLTKDTKYFSISIPNTDSKTKKVVYTLWYQNLTISYKLYSMVSTTYKVYGKIEENNVENTVGTTSYMLDVSTLNYPAELENQEEGAKLVAQNVLNKISFPFLIFECDVAGTPIFDVGDIVALSDINGKTFYSFITNMTFNVNGFTTIKCVANEVEK
ncbi:MAG: hypothetical protein HFG29_01420 [Eubacterium sp.]|nr:hypothetical protein [Eubacterium sp.]